MENHYLFLIALFPLLGALINGAIAMATSSRKQGASEGFVGMIAVSSVVLSFALTMYLFGSMQEEMIGGNGFYRQILWQWFSVGSLDINFSFFFDHLSSMMLMFITGIGSLIHLYSIGYMKGDRGFARFMAYLNLFMFSMIMLVLGDNLLVTFLGWEGVGLCSYLLIGFWHHDHENNDAARKAFITNRVGDLGFLLGTFVLFYAMQGTGQDIQFTFQGINYWAANMTHSDAVLGLITVATMLLFWGCTAKSAQIPLLTWLPDAMAGPTPVSALIHAATMVTAGIFLICRMSDLFVLSPTTMMMITIIGILTALYAAICAVFQWDIKKVLAYSTVSQLGFMFMAVGVGAFDVALFHVFTHAFFKATLFLGAGSIIYALHHEQDMRKMGCLAKKMPFTYAAMFFAWWAICGLPLGAGFMSKDLILERLFFFGGSDFAYVMWGLALIAAGLTAFYMTRLFVLTFYSNDRVDHEHVGPVKEAPMVMTIPVTVLGLGALLAGLAWMDAILVWMVSITNGMGLTDAKIEDFDGWRWLHEYLAPALHHAAENSVYFVHPAHEHIGMILFLSACSVVIAGFGCLLAWMKFKRGLDEHEAEVKEMSGFGKQWAQIFDVCYEMCICKPIMCISRCVLNSVDQLFISRVVKSIGQAVHYIGDGCRGIQRGHLRISMAMSLIAVLVLFVIVIFGSY